MQATAWQAEHARVMQAPSFQQCLRNLAATKLIQPQSGQATAWRVEHARAMRALRAEVGESIPPEALLAGGGGEHHPGEARWRGRAATIAMLREQLRAAQAALQVRFWWT